MAPCTGGHSAPRFGCKALPTCGRGRVSLGLAKRSLQQIANFQLGGGTFQVRPI